MPTSNDELLPLVRTNSSQTFFSRIKCNIIDTLPTLKKTTVFAAGIISGAMYWPSSFQAAKFGGSYLQYAAAVGGSFTNATFNIESFFNLFELSNLRKIPFKYLTASIISAFFVLPNFLMDIQDEEGRYVDNKYIALQGFIAFLNVWVNVVGTLELIDAMSLVCKNKTQREKEKLITKYNQLITLFSQLKLEEQTEANFAIMFDNQFGIPTPKKKLLYISVKSSLVLVGAPQLLAYTLISYFSMRDFAKQKWALTATKSVVLGVIAAIGKTLPDAGFSIKGLNATYKKLILFEKPTPLFWLFLIPVLFSGFTTHKAMADSLKQLNYSGSFAELLCWVANLGAAFLYNLPQVADLSYRMSGGKKGITDDLQRLSQSFEEYVNRMEPDTFKRFTTENTDGNTGIYQFSDRFFNMPRAFSPATINSQYDETSFIYNSIQNN